MHLPILVRDDQDRPSRSHRDTRLLLTGGGMINSLVLKFRGIRFPMLAGVTLTALCLLGACQPVSQPQFGQQIVGTTPISLVPGDVIKLTFPGSPELNQSQKIQTDGRVNLPMVGQVTAAGKTISQLQGELSARYKSQLQNTEVVVSLDSSVIPVIVSGAVEKPGKLFFDRPTTVFQAIMEAGGVNEFGNLKRVHLIRITNGQQETHTLNLKPTLQGTTTRAVYVKNGDIIYVPESMF